MSDIDKQTQELIAKLMAENAALKAKTAAKAGTLPIASIGTYTNQKGSTGTFVKIRPNGIDWGSAMLRLNDGPTLTAEGKAKLTAFANALGDFVDAKSVTLEDFNPAKKG